MKSGGLKPSVYLGGDNVNWVSKLLLWVVLIQAIAIAALLFRGVLILAATILLMVGIFWVVLKIRSSLRNAKLRR